MIRFLFSFFVWIHPPAGDPPRISVEQLRQRVEHSQNDTLYVVNFWATWCRPCLAELPYFEEITTTAGEKKVKVLLVSLDFQSAHKQLGDFVRKKKLNSEVCHLDAGNPNNWIDKIDSSWSGAIPASAFYRNGKKVHFYEGEFTQPQLNSIINTYLHQP